MEGATDIFSFGDICSDAIIILTRILAFELKHKRAFWVFREESLQFYLSRGEQWFWRHSSPSHAGLSRREYPWESIGK
jgi:hypothetical protein